MAQEKQVIAGKEELGRMISRMAHEMVEKTGGGPDCALIGIRSRGAYLARRIRVRIQEIVGHAPGLGIIDVTPYRDDRDPAPHLGNPASPEAAVSVDEKTVILVDDVIYTGRTIRAALEYVGRLGKPRRILVAILVDRGDRELPIKADIVGKNIPVSNTQRVNVLLQEYDGTDSIIVIDRN